MSAPDLADWLGPDHDLTPDQLDELTRHALAINTRLPEEKDQLKREAALAVALRLVRGERGVVEELAATRNQATATAAAALAGLHQAALMTVEWNAPPSRRNPNGENAFAVRAGVDRQLVRKWGGKK